MSFIKFNPNPTGKETGDCVVRAISIAEGTTWDLAFQRLTEKAFREKDMPSINPVWTNYLIEQGYTLHGIPNTCPRCYTVEDFAYDHPYGTYVLGTGTHAIAVIDGNYIDTWDSGDVIPMYYLQKGEKDGSNDTIPAGNTANRTTTAVPTNPAPTNPATAV